MPKFTFGRKEQKNKQEEPVSSTGLGSGEELSLEERAYLESLERQVAEGGKTSRHDEAEERKRRQEIQRLHQSFKPATPLYQGQQKPSSLQGQRTVPESRTMASDKQDPRRSYQNDPRYKEFYDRLKRQNPGQDPPSDYDEDPQPMTLEELERQGWDGKLKQPDAKPAANGWTRPQRPAAQAPLRQPASPRPATTPRSAPETGMKAGSIVRFDDDSVAIYKDAVSGKDYALFYFLEPNGILAPRGIFLEQYETEVIGYIPEELFTEMRMGNHWDRDAIIFHLAKFEHATYIRRLETRTPAANLQYSRPHHQPSPPPSSPRVERPERPHTPAPVERDPLERGRVVRINVAGKVWESVYWTKDEIGPIVAHDTNREWSLMHLDLSRFKDSLEYGDLLDQDRLEEIEESLARNSR